MPKYDYKCTVCGLVEEYEHSMDADMVMECSDCFAPVKKIISNPAGTHFKGQGWGKTYRVHKGKDIK